MHKRKLHEITSYERGAFERAFKFDDFSILTNQFKIWNWIFAQHIDHHSFSRFESKTKIHF